MSFQSIPLGPEEIEEDEIDDFSEEISSDEPDDPFVDPVTPKYAEVDYNNRSALEELKKEIKLRGDISRQRFKDKRNPFPQADNNSLLGPPPSLKDLESNPSED